MKSKLLIFIVIVTFALSVFTPALASSKVVDITRPEGNEIVTKDIFSICGVCLYDETTIELEYKNRDSDEYKPLYTTDGDSSFRVGNNRIFGKDIKLKYKGENEIRVIAYTNATRNKPQVNSYTITLVDKKEKGNWLSDAINWLTGRD